MLSEVAEKGSQSLIENRDAHCKILVDMQVSRDAGRQDGFHNAIDKYHVPWRVDKIAEVDGCLSSSNVFF